VNSNGIAVEKLDVGITDESGAEVVLTLYGRMLRSAVRTWIPHARTLHSTVLLISKASWKPSSRRANVNSRTIIEVNPAIVEAERLRRFADNVTALVNPPWPDGGKSRSVALVDLRCIFGALPLMLMLAVFDVEEFASSPRRVKYTLKDIDDL
jgi:hypothetical protein